MRVWLNITKKSFPLLLNRQSFIRELTRENPPENLLDIGCASGAFAFRMAAELKQVEAFDLDEQMVRYAQKNYPAHNLHFRCANMLDIKRIYGQQKFDVITCFGNTLVHLRQTEAAGVLRQVKDRLKAGGLFVLQILNYDYIFAKKINNLPRIENEVLSFERAYDLVSSDEIIFKTHLFIKNGQMSIESSIPLYPLGKTALAGYLAQAGFSEICFYKNYQGEAFDGEHISLILTARG